MRKRAYWLSAIAVLAAIACRPPGPPPEPEPPGPICTRDARLCPDGSAVGRTGPDCTFPPCPGDQTMPPPPNGTQPDPSPSGVSPDPAPPTGPDPDPEPTPM